VKISVSAESKPPPAGSVEVQFLPQEERGLLSPEVAEAEFSAKANSHLFLRAEHRLLIGLGAAADVKPDTFRRAAGTAVMFLKSIGRTSAHVDFSRSPANAGALVEGTILGDYRFQRFASQKTPLLQELQIRVPQEEAEAVEAAVRRAEVVAACTNLAREIGNLPGNLLYPEILADEALRLGKEHGLEVAVLDGDALHARGFGGLMAVGSGSAREPRLIVMHHRGGAADEPPIALVGKAITFDTGGISIKPAANMEELIFDKCGGTAVLGAMVAAAQLAIPVNVVGILACAENMPGGAAFRPGDIVETYGGKHIEVINTDAEGRVVLADALTYARTDLKAKAIIDLATLTGACGVALGEETAGLWSNNAPLRERIVAAAAAAGEAVWPMPITAEHRQKIKSDVALVKNSAGRIGGACTAAAFLERFVEETPWAHLDIAYPAAREKDGAGLAKGATGFGIRTLLQLLTDWRAF
jgi:leucyl aminopeptidase